MKKNNEEINCYTCHHYRETAGGPDHGDNRCLNTESPFFNRRPHEILVREGAETLQSCIVYEPAKSLCEVCIKLEGAYPVLTETDLLVVTKCYPQGEQGRIKYNVKPINPLRSEDLKECFVPNPKKRESSKYVFSKLVASSEMHTKLAGWLRGGECPFGNKLKIEDKEYLDDYE